MKLIEAKIKNYKSIDDSNIVTIDPNVTILVGQNESGKTAFLQALDKSNSIEPDVKYSFVEEYPRKGLSDYEPLHEKSPAKVAFLKYVLSEDEIEEINEDLEFTLFENLCFSLEINYKGGRTISLQVDEEEFLQFLIGKAPLSSEISDICKKSKLIWELIETLSKSELKTDETNFVSDLKKRFGEQKENWNALEYYVWEKFIKEWIPKFFYFDDYRILPGKVNLADLKNQVDNAKTNPKAYKESSKAVMSLLQAAGVDLASLTNPAGYENVKAKLESIAIKITDKIFEYWKQNQNLEVEFDIREDKFDSPPFNNGNNLYIRIKNQRHRVSVPFDQRSKGFIWFFSFIIWFSNIEKQIDTNQDVILLLDEPGLNLHALAQDDFLRYIEDLASKHQIIYTTHSPFMVPGDKLHRVRTVEDRVREGTKISSNITSSDPKTVFPLQAALGYTIAQNLFISKRNLLVEGPADLIYIRFFSSMLESIGKTSLRSDIIVVPVGGLDKLATFVALLGGNQLEIVVLHDYNNKPDERLESLIRDKIISSKMVLNYAYFRSDKLHKPTKKGDSPKLLSSDVEDMITPALYLELFNAAYVKELKGLCITETDLPDGDRIVDRISKYIKDKNLVLRASGGYNHYLVANWLASHPLTIEQIDKETLSRFENLFEGINSIFSKDEE